MRFERPLAANWIQMWLAGIFLSCGSVFAQQPAIGQATDSLEQLSNSLQQVVAKVSPSIVKVEAVGYSRSDEDQGSDTQLIVKSETVASGIILDSSGYIVTNAHVVKGARRVRVVLAPQSLPQTDKAVASQRQTRFEARIVGTFAEADLAVLKIDATGLPALRLADSDSIKQGQLVFAVGNPQGLNNSVSIGIVSGVARKSREDGPPVYIQTDAAINQGSSGGALVDIHGHLVGVTSFILTESGGSEGLGFALSGSLVYLIYQELKTYGYVRVGDIGVKVQEVTPTMASGLRLLSNSGLIISDVVPHSPAETAGIQVQDIILSLDGLPIENAAQFATAFYRKRSGDHVDLKLLRGTQTLATNVVVREASHEFEDFLEAPNVQRRIVNRLGIVAATLNEQTISSAPNIRSKSGVLVVASIADTEVSTGLEANDVIRTVNGKEVKTLEGFRALLQQLKAADAVVLQIERRGRLMYLAFELD